MTLTDMRSGLQAESFVWMFRSPLVGGGGLLWRTHYRPYSLLWVVIDKNKLFQQLVVAESR